MASDTAAPGGHGERRERGLSTARAVLRVTSLLAHAPEGVRADEVATALGKSVSTAYNLLASLCDEGVAARQPGGHYRLTAGFRDMVVAGVLAPAELPALGGVVDDLLARTHKRAYLGVVQAGHLRVLLERGVQGMPKLPGLTAELDDRAHALALGKVVLAAASRPALEAYLRRGLRAFTPATVTAPEALRAELAEIRRTGLAFEREELEPDFCCMAAPVCGPGGRFLGAVGISMTSRAYDDDREHLAETLRDVARAASGEPPPAARPRFQPCADPREVLALDGVPDLACGPGRSVR
jgi:DNA-binding IclR family transcriptional regulator